MNHAKPCDVSVLITSFLASSTLADSIQSGLDEVGLSVEIVVVLDGATQSDDAVIRQFTDKRLRVISPGRVGRGRALNMGIEISSSPLVRILDADDRIFPDSLAHQFLFMNDHPEFDAVGGQLIQTGPWGRREFRVTWPLRPSDIDARLARGRMPIAHPTVMMRKCFLERLGGYDESVKRVEDLDLILRGSKGGNYANMDEALAVYATPTEFPTWEYWRNEEAYRRAIVARIKHGGNGAVSLSRQMFIHSYTFDYPKWIGQKALDRLTSWRSHRVNRA